MKYLNKFNELILEAQLKIVLAIREDSINNLAYLIDEGFDVSTRNNLRYVVTTIGKPSRRYMGGTIESYTIHWKDIKYEILQYLELMSSKYNLEFIEFLGFKKLDDITSTYINWGTKIFTIEQLEKSDDFLFDMISINFTKNWKRKNESLSFSPPKELTDMVNNYLAYLLDENFVVNIDYSGMEIIIKKSDNSRFNWEDIKYDFIPFMEELTKENTLSKSGRRTGIIFVNYYEISALNEFIRLDEIVNDTIEGSMSEIVIELERKMRCG